ncbi:hypothetical protein [Streptosporangium sp. NPDC000396]|uniref:hypothetical protein n=1 Tax=Streptosporangium sp. NPDC000396 TaxID=3366185 RepID=UPI00369C69E1
MTTDLDRIVSSIAPDPGPGFVPGARELMNEIMDTEPLPAPVRRRRPGWRIALPAVALLAATVTVLSWTSALPGFGPKPVAALDIKQEGGYFVIEVKDLYADPENYEAQLNAAGLDVSLRVIPATPGLVGSILATAPDDEVIDEFKTIEPAGKCDKVGGCPIGLKIPVGFTGTAYVTLKRQAKPGERYSSFTSFDALGEPMHCVPYLNKTVAEVRALLKERGLTIQKFMVSDPRSTEASDYEMASSVPDSWYVHGGTLIEPGKVTIDTHSTPLPPDQLQNLKEASGCSGQAD